MPLLLQLYAPLDWVSKSAYHRLLFILCCKNASCHSPRDPSLPLPFYFLIFYYCFNYF